MRVVDESSLGVYEANTHAAMSTLLQRAVAKREAAAREQQLLEAYAYAAAAAALTAVPTLPASVDSVAACAHRIHGEGGEGGGGDGGDVAVGRQASSSRQTSSHASTSTPHTPATVDLRMPRGFACSAVVDGEYTQWGDKFPDIVPVFEAGDHTVCDLTVSHPRCGTIHWPGRLSFTASFTLCEVLELAPGVIGVYGGVRDKPEYGEALNRHAVVTLLNIRPLDGVSLDSFIERLTGIAEESGRFIAYTAESGEWSFEIDRP